MFTWLKEFFHTHSYEKVLLKERLPKFHYHSKCTRCGKEKYFKINKYPPTGRMRG